MVRCRLGYIGGCKLNDHRASFIEHVYFHNNECNSQLENCLYAEKYPGLKRLVAEEFAGDVKRIINSFLPREKHQACMSELGKVFKECIDSNCERYRIIDFQIKIYEALEKEYVLGDELCSNALKWVGVFQKFR